MTASGRCHHPDVHFNVGVVHLQDTGVKYLEITGVCHACGGEVTFPGCEIGLDPGRPMVSVLANEIRIPFHVAGEVPTGKPLGFRLVAAR